MSSSYRGQGYRGRGANRGGGRGGRGHRGGRGGQQPRVYQPTGINTEPSAQVTAIEDSIIASKGQLPGVGQHDVQTTAVSQHPKRPGFGTKGDPVILWANYVQLIPPRGCTLFIHHVTVTPDAVGKRLGRIIELALEVLPLSHFKDDIATDYRATIISQQKLSTEDLAIYVKYRADGEDEPTERAIQYLVQVQCTNTLPVSELIEQAHHLGTSQELSQALNIFVNDHSRSTRGLTQIGANKTFPFDSRYAQTRELGFGLTASRGFFSSVRLATSRTLLNINPSYGAFYQASRLDELMRSFAGSNHGHGNKVGLNKFLARVAVKTTHLPIRRNRANQVIDRVKRISGIATKDDGQGLEYPPRVPQLGAGSNEVQFWLEPRPPANTGVSSSLGASGSKGKRKASFSPPVSSAGQYITVEAYFRETYKQKLLDPRAPVVNVGSKDKPIYLPPEVCVVLPGQGCSSRLSGQQTSEMIRYAVRKPYENAHMIIEHGIGTLGLEPEKNKKLTQFGMKVESQLITVPARVLNVPKVRYERVELFPYSGSWNLRDVMFIQPKSLARWSTLILSVGAMGSLFTKDSASDLMRSVAQVFRKTGMSVEEPIEPNQVSLHGVYDPGLDNIMMRAAQLCSLLFIILPTNDATLYNRIKLLGDVKNGVHTVCFVGSKVFGKDITQLSQYFANIALKVNLKLGGANHQLEGSRLPLIREGRTMLVGIDVTHPSPGSQSAAPSVAGVVASIDSTLGQFPAALRIQEARRESVADLTGMFKSRLELWARHNSGRYPDNIVVYRDGVSEGQYGHVLSMELPQLRRAARELYPAPDTERNLPRITIIVVGKRHHTRFYPTSVENADRGSNTKPGTVVDRGVTLAWNWDFFLQPHAAIQGTTRPGHYYILLDEVFRARYPGSPTAQQPWPQGAQNMADVVEEFTHSLCYMYGRATKAVSLCPPAYYADIVCERARAYLHRVFDSPVTSEVGSSAEGGMQMVDDSDVKVHAKLENTMFYI